MVPPKVNFWSISRKESLEYQQQHALTNRFLQTLFEMTISILGTIGKCSLGRDYPFLTKFLLFMNSCFIQYNAPLEKYVNVAQKINSLCQKRLVLSTWDHFHHLQGTIYFGNGKRQY